MTRTNRSALRGACAWMALTSALLGCAAQVDSDYQGEPLATIHGTVAVAQGALAADQPLSAAIMWYYQDSANQYQSKYVSSRVAVRGSFPASFTLDVYTPPPASAQLTTEFALENPLLSIPAGTPLGIWTGFLVAIDSRVSDTEATAADVVGVDLDHALVYIDAVVKPWLDGDPITNEAVLQGFRHDIVTGYEIDPTPGFHLAKMNPAFQEASRKLNDCIWADACVHQLSTDPRLQEMWDWRYERCTERFPQNPTCTAYDDTFENEPASSVECKAMYFHDRDCGLDVGQTTVPNPAGLDDPSTISIGRNLYDIGT